MLRMATATLHVKRHLTERELTTLGVALEWLARAPASPEIDELMTMFPTDAALISDADMKALAFELTRARKVKVCRSKVPTQ
jgi:hypothetical protein